MDYWWLLLTEGIPRSESGPYIHDRTGENLIFCPIDPFVDRWKSVKPFFQIQPGSPLFQTKLKKKLLLIFQGFVRKFCWPSVGENNFFSISTFFSQLLRSWVKMCSNTFCWSRIFVQPGNTQDRFYSRTTDTGGNWTTYKLFTRIKCCLREMWNSVSGIKPIK